MPNPLCDLWDRLLHQEANRGQIYSDFLTERLALIAHLQNCELCEGMLTKIWTVDIKILDLEGLTIQQFGEFIRELWKESKNSIITLPM